MAHLKPSMSHLALSIVPSENKCIIIFTSVLNHNLVNWHLLFPASLFGSHAGHSGLFTFFHQLTLESQLLTHSAVFSRGYERRHFFTVCLLGPALKLQRVLSIHLVWMVVMQDQYAHARQVCSEVVLLSLVSSPLGVPVTLLNTVFSFAIVFLSTTKQHTNKINCCRWVSIKSFGGL